jgi:hypothetical protein
MFHAESHPDGYVVAFPTGGWDWGWGCSWGPGWGCGWRPGRGPGWGCGWGWRRRRLYCYTHYGHGFTAELDLFVKGTGRGRLKGNDDSGRRVYLAHLKANR